MNKIDTKWIVGNTNSKYKVVIFGNVTIYVKTRPNIFLRFFQWAILGIKYENNEEKV